MVAVTVVAKREDIVMSFFDRARELADLKEIRERSESVAQFTVVTGRRRVGKTSLSNFRQAAGNGAISERPRLHGMSWGTKTAKFMFCAEVVA